MSISLITGVAGQDGSYLAEYLLSEGHSVIGVTRRVSSGYRHSNIVNILKNKNFTLVQGDITDYSFVYDAIKRYRPIFWYNLAAQSNVGQSFVDPIAAFEVNSKSVMVQLKAISELSPNTKFYQASTTEIYGGTTCPDSGYSELSTIHPISPYAISKASAHWITRYYRDSLGLYACNGITGNHSSPRRGFDFATRKITSGTAKIKLGLQDKIMMGNLNAFRDEGHSRDYINAIYLIMNQDCADDYIISTGSGATIEDMFRYVCKIANLRFEDVYQMDERYIRPSDVPRLLGDPKKLRAKTGWSPSYNWRELLKEMYESDIQKIRNGDIK